MTTEKLGRRLEVTSKKLGTVDFNLLDENGNCIAEIIATPYKTRIIGGSDNIVLSSKEKIFCQMTARKTLNRLL